VGTRVTPGLPVDHPHRDLRLRLIGWNIKVSLSNWRQAQPTSHYAGLGAYRDLAHDAQFRLTLAHLLIFTIVFALGTLIIGWTLALLLDKGVKGEGFFRAVYLLRTGGPDGERIGVALQRSLWLASARRRFEIGPYSRPS